MRRSLNSNELIAKYGIHRRTFDDVLELLDVECKALTLKIDKFLSENRGVVTPRRKLHGSSTVTSPAKTPSRRAGQEDESELSPSKRKTVLPPLPFMTPKKKIMSPVKLNRIPVGTYSSTSTPSRVRMEPSSNSTPKETFATRRSWLRTPANDLSPDSQSCLRSDSGGQTSSKRVSLAPDVAVDRTDDESNAESSTIPPTPSPHKPLRRKASMGGTLTPTTKRPRMRAASPTPTQKNKAGSIHRVHTEPPVSNSSEDEEAPQPPCRHHTSVFADRTFYHYRDPRTIREWEACERFMKEYNVSYTQVSVG